MKSLPICLLIFISLIAFNLDAKGQFQEAQQISKNTLSGLESMQSADFDGDGDLDILVLSSVYADLLWYENKGEGNFSSQQRIKIQKPKDVSVVSIDFLDFNNDGFADVVLQILDGIHSFDVMQGVPVPNYYKKIIYYQNDTNGGLEERQAIQDILSGTKVIFTDINTDHFIDLIIPHTTATKSAVLFRNNQNGGFEELEITESTFYAQFLDAFILDLDEDGDLDILAKDRSGIWYENDGKESFEKRLDIITDEEIIGTEEVIYIPRTKNIADIDGDGRIDVLLENDRKMLIWAKNNGGGNFGQPIFIFQYQYDFAPDEFIPLDVGSNGTLDVLLKGRGEVRWVENQGNADFSELKDFIHPVHTNSFTTEFDLSIRDIEQDNDLDILIAYEDAIEVYENVGTSIFEHPIQLEPDYPISHSLLDDFDKDGKIDIVTYYEQTEAIWFHHNQANNELASPELIEASTINHPISGDIGDFNGDGLFDVLSASFQNGEIGWHPNNGEGVFEDKQIIASMYPEGMFRNYITYYQGKYIRAADLNRDGIADVVYRLIEEDKNLLVWKPNDGAGSFGDYIVIEDGTNLEVVQGQSDSEAISFIVPVDIDKDEDTDLIVSWSNQWGLYRNGGTGTFVRDFMIAEEGNMYGIEVVNLDNDGYLDILLLDDQLSWYKNNFNISFTLQESNHVTPFHNNNLVFARGIADFDMDGDMDFAAVGHNDDNLLWFANDGQGNFHKEYWIDSTSHSLQYLEIVDIDFDKQPDILLSNGRIGLQWYRNKGEGIFEKQYELPITYPTYGPWSIGMNQADMDNDGDIDIVADIPFANKVVWFENEFSPFTIHANTFWDENENGLWDTNELPLEHGLLLHPKDELGYSNANGNVVFFVSLGQYSLSASTDPLWTPTTPPINEIVITEDAELPTYNFGFTPNRILPQVKPLLNSSPTRCSTATNYWLHYSNTGTTIANGIITLETDELMEFISSNPSADLIEDGRLTWNISNLPPTQEGKISLQFQMPDFNSIGEILETQASLQLFNENQELVYSKSTDYHSEVRCSYDPNDKLFRSNLLGQSESAYISDTLLYTVRFQNTGNDTAFNIRIEDYLDKRLDWTTFHPITASHAYRTELNRETGLVTFYFDDILLPDSTTNEPESHGFVLFGIASLEDVEDKTEVRNTAFIFFDFNPPIVTNTVNTVLIELDDVSIGGDTRMANAREYEILVYPNPFSDYTMIEVEGLPQGEYQLEVMDVLGRKVQELEVENGKAVLERGKLANGLYLIQVLEKESNRFLGSGKALVE